MRNIPKQIHISVVLVVLVLAAYRMAWVILGIYSLAW
jgi:hypothetical protein